jgi:hypothetical protein
VKFSVKNLLEQFEANFQYVHEIISGGGYRFPFTMRCLNLIFLLEKRNTSLSPSDDRGKAYCHKKSQSESLRRKDQKYLLIFFQEDYCSMSSPT